MEEDLNLLRKTELILGGSVRLPPGFRVPVRISRSTAGPGAGNGSVVFGFNGMRVKKSISFDEGDFELHQNGDSFSITKGGKPFLDSVDIIPVAFHCPEQAFFNLDQKCIFNCIYCASPLLSKNVTKHLTNPKIVSMILEASKSQTIKSIALTSGVVGDVQSTVDKFVSCVKDLRGTFPDMPIGVEPYIDRTEQIDALHEAGATEIKINCETADDGIFRKACPELDRENIFRMLEYAVGVFGKGAVASNIIYGLGETDGDIVFTMERLASLGVAPGLRPLRISSATEDRIAEALGDIEPITSARMIRLAKEQKRILSENGLDTRTFHTMCFECTCCDIVPFRDL